MKSGRSGEFDCLDSMSWVFSIEVASSRLLQLQSSVGSSVLGGGDVYVGVRAGELKTFTGDAGIGLRPIACWIILLWK